LFWLIISFEEVDYGTGSAVMLFLELSTAAERGTEKSSRDIHLNKIFEFLIA